MNRYRKVFFLMFILILSSSFIVFQKATKAQDIVVTVTSQINSSTDDAEETVSSGWMYLNSTDLELVTEETKVKTVGMRFNGLNIPQGAVVTNAYVEFQADELQSETTTISLYGQNVDSATTFANRTKDISSRIKTIAKVDWDIPAWSKVGVKYQTPNISSLVQEIVNRSGWTSGNSMAILATGTGHRTAESYDGSVTGAPKLVVSYTTGSMTPTPSPTPTSVPTATSVSTPTPSATPASTPSPTATPIPGNFISFGVIGDYGENTTKEREVANMLKALNPDLIVTTGDNNYLHGEALTIDRNIGQYYSNYIYPYYGTYGSTATVNRFFPVPGNHDWQAPNLQPYLDYFTLPGNERYYDFIWGPVHFFMLDADLSEPDGDDINSLQAQWLEPRLKSSSTPFQIVLMHKPPYSSGSHGSDLTAQWPYAEWGADAVLSGHDHTYERIMVNNIPYFVNGSGGASLYSFASPIAGSVVRYNDDNGAMYVEANTDSITFKFYNTVGSVIDTYTIYSSTTPTPTSTPTPIPTPTPTPTPTGIVTVTSQINSSTDDAEETVSSGWMYLNSTDLELVTEETRVKTVGMRFNGLNIPQGAVVTNAYVEFQADELQSETTTISLYGQDVDSATTFTDVARNISSRVKTVSSVDWDIPAWSKVGVKYQTPNISSLVQEIVNRSGWTSGNSMAILATGTGHRTAESYDGSVTGAPKLVVSYTQP